MCKDIKIISIHKALASLDFSNLYRIYTGFYISIHKALASLDENAVWLTPVAFISIHKALASLDPSLSQGNTNALISIHKALASLDYNQGVNIFLIIYFNPQGSREPRL